MRDLEKKLNYTFRNQALLEDCLLYTSVESPAKAKTIGKYLGKEFEVKACMGHLRDLPKSTLGVDLEHDFEPVYKPIKGKEDIIADRRSPPRVRRWSTLPPTRTGRERPSPGT